MHLDQSPIYRREIVPWYDADWIGWIVVCFMLATFAFGMTGVSVARENPAFRSFLWLPLVLVSASVLVIITTVSRLLGRNVRPPGE